MNYANSLKALRARMLSKTTGMDMPESQGLESFIPARAGQEQPQESTGDLLTRAAGWLSEVKSAASLMPNIRKEPIRSSGGGSVGGFMEGFMQASRKNKEAKEEAERKEKEAEVLKEAFVARRSESSPSTYAPERPNEGSRRRILEAPPAEGPVAGYGEISQKTMEQIIRSEAEARKIDPDVAVAIFRSEGAGNYQSQVPRQGKGAYNNKEDSWGPFQLYRGGGLGNEYEKLTGRNLRQDNTIEGITNQIRFSLDRAVTQGWTPWYGRKTAGVGVRDGLANAQPLGNWK